MIESELQIVASHDEWPVRTAAECLAIDMPAPNKTIATEPVAGWLLGVTEYAEGLSCEKGADTVAYAADWVSVLFHRMGFECWPEGKKIYQNCTALLL